jgi:hypothetical protein
MVMNHLRFLGCRKIAEQSNFEIYFQIFSPAGLERQIGFQALHGSLSSPSFLKGAV